MAATAAVAVETIEVATEAEVACSALCIMTCGVGGGGRDGCVDDEDVWFDETTRLEVRGLLS